jgi:hypothetical protein
MPRPETPSGQGKPDPFTQITEGLFGQPELEKMGRELKTGFTGPLAEKAGEWQKEGLGRFIGIPMAVTDPKDRVDRVKYMAYALPLTDTTVTGHDRRVLLVFPNENSFDAAIVSPKLFKGENEQRQNESSLRDFQLVFMPSDKPTLMLDWKHDPHAKHFLSFQKFSFIFPAVHISPEGKSKEQLLEEAVANARKMKRIEEVRNLKVDDDSLGSLHPEVVVTLEELNNDMKRWEEGKET